MKNHYTILLLVLSLLAVSCSKGWLDAKPDKKLVVPGTLSDLQGLIDNAVVINLNYSDLPEIAADGHYLTDAIYLNSPKTYKTDAYIWDKTVPYIAQSATDWVVCYQRVLYCNIVLDGVSKITPIDSSEMVDSRNIRGQALFNRAYSFFELAQLYAIPYSSLNANENLGIVLRLSSDITLQSKRSSVKQTYDQIISDLLESIELLPTAPKFLGRASKLAAYGLLSRVYLSMGDYDNSFLYANKALQSNANLLDFNDFPANLPAIGLYNKEVLFHSSLTSSSFVVANCLIDRSLFDLYDVNDLRKTVFFRLNANGTISFKGSYNSNINILFSGISTNELYLTRAECYARKGETNLALKDINDLLKFRYKKTVTLPIITANSSEIALEKIINERKKELVLRGIRWMDLRRLNQEPKFAVAISRIIAGKTYTLEPNSYKYTFPIPDNIVEQIGIQQNPGWNK